MTLCGPLGLKTYRGEVVKTYFYLTKQTEKCGKLNRIRILRNSSLKVVGLRPAVDNKFVDDQTFLGQI